jgi:hypothetical protein
MKAKYGKQVPHRLLTSLLGLAACFVAVPLGHAQTGADTTVPQSPAGNPDPATGGMRVYVDPQTGAVRPEPAPGTVPLPLSPQEQNSFSTSHEGLVEVPSSVPGGGVKVDLQGRFQSPLIGTIGADGKVELQHLDSPHESGDKK